MFRELERLLQGGKGFEAKLKLARVLRLVTKQQQSKLDHLRSLRNKCAHSWMLDVVRKRRRGTRPTKRLLEYEGRNLFGLKVLEGFLRTYSSLTEAIAEREKKIREITDRLVEPGRGSLQEKLDELRTFAVSRLTDLRRLLSKPANVHEARALLAEQFGKFTLSPFEDAGKWSYTAKGSVDLIGEKLIRVDGAGGQTCT